MRPNILRASMSALLIALAAAIAGCTEDRAVDVSGPSVTPTAPDRTDGAAFAIGPIPGLTTAWYPAPRRTAVQLGTVITLKCRAKSDARVRWTGAAEVDRTSTASFAECPVDDPQPQTISAEIVVSTSGKGDGGIREPAYVLREVHRCLIEPIDVALSDIQLRRVSVVPERLEPTHQLSNQETMDLYFGPSIAALSRIGSEHYRTSVDRPFRVNVQVTPEAFSPLIELSVDGEARSLGSRPVVVLDTPGSHKISVGPERREIVVDTYGVKIVSHRSNSHIVDGRTETFEAATDPPGFEDDITWLSSTKTGTGVPTFGCGPTFTVRFEDTWGSNGFRWLGVKADNVVFNLDQKLNCAPGPQVWESAQDIDFGASQVPYAPYCENEYVGTAGTHFIGPGTAGDVVTRVQVLTPGVDPQCPAAPAYQWSSNPQMSDYGAWLNGCSADFVWNRAGIYALKITRAFSGSSIEFVLADAFLLGCAKPLDVPQKKGNFPSDADLIIVGEPDDTANDGMAEQAGEAVGTANVLRATTCDQARDAIIAKSMALGRPIKVVLAGHGSGGFFTFGPKEGSAANQQLFQPESSEDIDEKTLAFADAIKGKVSEVGFVACSTGEGDAGTNFVDLLRTRTGVPAWAYTATLSTSYLWRWFQCGGFQIHDDGNKKFGYPVTATLETKVCPSNGGTVTPAPGVYMYPRGETVAITATPNPGWKFCGWDWAGAGTSGIPLPPADVASPATTVIVERDKVVAPRFVLENDDCANAPVCATDP